MVTQYGMSDRIGAIQLGGGDSEPFMGMQGSQPSKGYSESSAAIVDAEVSHLIHTAHQEAFDTLVENRDVLDELVRQLFARETLNRKEVAEIFVPLRRRDKRPAWTGSDLRVPSGEPPIDIPASPEKPVVAQPAPTPPSTVSGTDPVQPPSTGPDTWEPPAWGPPKGPRS